MLCGTLPSELQSDKLSARKSEKGSAGPMSSEPSWTSPPLKRIKNVAVYRLSFLKNVYVCMCVFEYLEEILDVLTTIESGDISREL